jgi:hypothetical protein
MSLSRPRRPLVAALAAAAALVAPVAVPAAAAAWPAPSYLAPLSEIVVRGGHLGWDGVVVGMTLRDVERKVGRLAAPAAEPEMLCPHHRTDVVVDGQPLGLEFSGTGDEAVLRAILIPLVPRIGESFDTRAVVGALRDRLELSFVPSPHAPRLGEDEVEKPLYRTGDDELVFVNPEAGVVIGEVCVD